MICKANYVPMCKANYAVIVRAIIFMLALSRRISLLLFTNTINRS